MMKIIFYILTFFSFYTFGYDDLKASIDVSASAMKAEGKRLKIAANNIANESSTGLKPGEDAYRRRLVILGSKYDRKLQANKVVVKRIAKDFKPFKLVYMPNHPAANKNGIVKFSNIDINIENADVKDASRNYEANLSMIEAARNMQSKTLDMLK